MDLQDMNEKRKYRVLLVDDDPGLLRLLTMRLESLGFEVYTCSDGKDGLSKVDLIRPDVVVTDLRMDKMDGLELFRISRKLAPYLPFIIITAHGTIPDAVSATQEGVFAYITKPINKEELVEAIQNAVLLSGGSEKPISADDENCWSKNIITRSPLITEIINKAKLVAETDVRIMISGESGTGKRLLARTIHDASSRSNGPFISVNSSVLTEESLEKEVLPSADGGTLFLYEIGEISPSLQVKLGQLLKGGAPSSSEKTSGFDVRVISATAQDLKAKMRNGEFREDLYYGLSVVAFALPSLEDRREDIPLLARHFLGSLASELKSEVRDFAPDALKLITEACWPGNVRQLYHVVEQLVVLSTTSIIPSALVEKALEDLGTPLPSFSEARSNFERDYLIRLLKMCEGNVSQAARSAKRNRTDFYKLLARNNIEPAMIKRNLTK